MGKLVRKNEINNGVVNVENRLEIMDENGQLSKTSVELSTKW